MYQLHLVHRWKFMSCVHTCSAFAMPIQMLAKEWFTNLFICYDVTVGTQVAQLVSRFYPTGTQMVSLDWMTRFCPLYVGDWVIVSPSRNRACQHSSKQRQQLGTWPKSSRSVYRLEGLVAFPSHTNVIIIRTSQHYVAFPHPPHVHSIEWIFFFSFPHFFPFISLFLVHGVPESIAFSRTLHARCFPLALCLVGFQVMVGLQFAGLELDAKKLYNKCERQSSKIVEIKTTTTCFYLS